MSTNFIFLNWHRSEGTFQESLYLSHYKDPETYIRILYFVDKYHIHCSPDMLTELYIKMKLKDDDFECIDFAYYTLDEAINAVEKFVVETIGGKILKDMDAYI